MKKYTLCLTLIFALSVIPAVGIGAEQGGVCGNGLTWSVDGGVLTVSGSGVMEDYLSGEDIPWLTYADSITSVVIEEGVTAIGNKAFFGCTALKELTLPEGLQSIGDEAFLECRSLTSISFPSSLTEIGGGAFQGCRGLTEVNFSEGLQAVNEWTFAVCEGLTAVDLPESLTCIGEYAFYSSGLETVNIPAGVTAIGKEAFGCCEKLESMELDGDNANYTVADGVLFNSDMTELIKYPAKRAGTEYAVPDGVTKISEGAFAYCAHLTAVTLPNSLTEISDSAFFNSLSLTSINIPGSVTSIGYGAFKLCSGLTELELPESVEYIGNSAFEDCPALSLKVERFSFAEAYAKGNDIPFLMNRNFMPHGPRIEVLVNGSEIEFDVPPMLIDGTTMLSIRSVFEPLGAEFTWDEETQTVTASADGKNIVITIGSETALVDDAEKILLKPAIIIDGRTLIPLRFVAEEFGYNVDWDDETKTVNIYK